MIAEALCRARLGARPDLFKPLGGAREHEL